MTEEVQNPTSKVERDEKGRWLPGTAPNPDGTGGFGERQDDINYTGRPKNQESFTYWMNFFKNLTIDELENWLKLNPKTVRTVAADLAFKRVFNAQEDLQEFREVADRTEGKAPQTIIHEGGFFNDTRLEIIEVANESETEPETEAGA